jgi:hypothetical protein
LKCSEKNFLTSQALYGLMIAHPKWKRKKLIKHAKKFADKLLK